MGSQMSKVSFQLLSSKFVIFYFHVIELINVDIKIGQEGETVKLFLCFRAILIFILAILFSLEFKIMYFNR